MVFAVSSPWSHFPFWFRALLIFAPLVTVAGTLLLSVVYLDRYFWVTGEDGLVEWATVVCYLLALGVAGALVPRWWSRGLPLTAVAYVLLCGGFIFIAGEEVSWGERILGFEGPPALVERNLQGEANLHNLLDRYALHGFYIVAGIWGVGLGRWVTRRVSWLRPWYAYAPSRELFWWFLPALVYYVYVDYVVLVVDILPLPFALGEGPDRFQEVVELLLGAGLFLFVLEAWRRHHRAVVSESGPAVGPAPAARSGRAPRS